MLNFFKWCETHNRTLPSVAENTKRSGIRGQYPDGYIRNQYPKGYFAPVSASAFLDLKNAEGVKTKKG